MAWFWEIWQQMPERMDPVLFSIGGFKLQYYGLMYIVAFALTYVLVGFRLKREQRFQISKHQVQDLMTFMILGLIIGARLGYVLFYSLSYYLQHPLEVILPFTFSGGIAFTGITGMSYHGGLIGVLLGSSWYLRKQKLDFWETADLFVPAIPFGYTFGRLGNFINGELYGRITESPIGMYFPLAPYRALRHPSQLYEAFFEGLFLFIVLWQLKKIQRPTGAMLSFYLIGYGLVRFVIEFFRQPDAHLGLVFLTFSMGQLLCFAMITGGILLYVYLYRKERVLAALA
jgi:phosphatidylglycerol:prolipoprotein diacylglycerol transferase